MDSADDGILPASGVPVIVGNGTVDASSPWPPSASEGKKHPIGADNGSTCSNRSTDAASSRASEREGTLAMDDSPVVVGPSIGSKSTALTQDDAVATPRTLKADACLPSSPI